MFQCQFERSAPGISAVINQAIGKVAFIYSFNVLIFEYYGVSLGEKDLDVFVGAEFSVKSTDGPYCVSWRSANVTAYRLPSSRVFTRTMLPEAT